MKDININTIYDLIILPFNTFCYLYTLDDLKRFFTGIEKISNSNTIIVIDIINPNIDDMSEQKKYKLCNHFIINHEMCMILLFISKCTYFQKFVISLLFFGSYKKKCQICTQKLIYVKK